MKPLLVISLGNPLVGDDGIGCRVAARLARDPELAGRADFLEAGSDLLRWSEDMEGRERVILIDAVLGDSAPGVIAVYREPFAELDDRWDHAHLPSVVQAVRLLRATSPTLRDTSFVLIGVSVPELGYAATLSEREPEIADRVRRAIRSLDRGARDPFSRSAGAARR